MINLEELPDFAPNGYDVIDLQGLDCKFLLENLPESIPFFWLESHQQGHRYLFLGECWSLLAFPNKVVLKQHEKSQVQSLDKPLSYRKLLNDLESLWLPRQPDAFKLAWALSYEAGWNEETKRQNKPKVETPELFCACPKAILIQKLDYSEAQLIQPKHWPSINFSKQRQLKENFAEQINLKCEENTESYLNKIDQVKQHIRQGDSFQVNLSRGFEGTGPVDLYSWAYQAFKHQASSYGALLKNDTFSLLSLSPERLIAGEGNKLITRPIAGTLPVSEGQSQEQLNNFKTHPKELAEHNMLIDLERNDLGKVSEPGSVEVEEYLCIESLPHVHHLVSQVIGKKQKDKKFGDILFALFPGGTITGCPKLETMHIIDALEKNSRAFYTGSLGYLGKDVFDSNILIRSALIVNQSIYMRFGGGLVWDSDPNKEVLETYAKARGLIKSLIIGGADFDSDHRSLRQFFA